MLEIAGGQPLHDPPVYLLEYCPPHLRLEVYEQFVQGFAGCMESLAYVVTQGMLPKPRMVMQTAPVVRHANKDAIKFYFDAGGAAEYAIDAVLALCEDSNLSQMVPHPESSQSATLPVCSNDGQWQLLRQQIFSNSSFWPNGPYPMEDEFEGGVEDGDTMDDGWVHYDTSNWKPPSSKVQQ